jgi:hypothetical protein
VGGAIRPHFGACAVPSWIMLSLRQNEQTQERPRGVTAIVAVCALLAALALVYAGLLAAGRIPLSAGAFLLGGGIEQLGPVAFLLYGLLLSALSLALWRRWKGARRLAIVFAAAGIAMAVPAVSSAVVDERGFAITREGLQIIVRVVAIYYLSQEPVREWFAQR